MDLRVAPFTTYGQMGEEIHDIIGEVAAFVSAKGDRKIDEKILTKMYTRDMACTLHKATAKLMVARMDLIRRNGNALGKIGDDFHVIAGKVLDQIKLFNSGDSASHWSVWE